MAAENNNEKLPGDYVAGFVDGEGCFYLTYRKEIKHHRKGAPVYYRWTPYFAITLREDDIDIFYKIKSTLGCGSIYLLKAKGKEYRLAYFGIQNMDDLFNKILPFFRKYPLRAKKRLDYELWSKALLLLYKYKIGKYKIGQRRCSTNDHKVLFEIRKQMRTYKSKMSRGYKNSPTHTS